MPGYSQDYSNEIGTKHIIKSAILDEEREIRVVLPPGYDTIQTPLPVLFILDGEYRFNPSFGIYSYMTYWRGVPTAILVGISNISRQSRGRDLLPSVAGGQSDKFLSFLSDELIPFVGRKFKVSRKYLIGHSHGGVFTLFTFLKAPALFDGYVACDPSLAMLIPYAEENLQTSYSNKSIYLCSSEIGDGVDENIKRSHMDGFNRFVAVLKEKKIKGLNLKISHIVDDHANSYVQGFSEGLRYIFSSN